MQQTAAKLKGARISAQKARLVADQIRGKQVEEALNILEEFSRNDPKDKFIKLQIEARLALGQFDEVLNLQQSKQTLQ